jgi:aspartate/methionine/tyrosine aminotransferase
LRARGLCCRQQVADHANRKRAQLLTASEIVITTGAIGALFSALMAIIDPGDEVLIPDPGWPNYEAIVHLASGNAVRYVEPASRGFLPDPAEIARVITPRTKALLINTPGNPSGAVFPACLIAELGDITSRTGIYLVSDEIYEDIVFESEHASAATHAPADRAFIVSGFSKTYAMTGWRLGWLMPTGSFNDRCRLTGTYYQLRLDNRAKSGRAAHAGDQASVGIMREISKRPTRYRGRRFWQYRPIAHDTAWGLFTRLSTSARPAKARSNSPRIF